MLLKAVEVVLTIAVTGAVGWMVKSLKGIHSKMENNEVCNRALARDRLRQAYRYYMAQGYLPISERDNIAELFKAYSANGGNGVTAKLYSRMMELPTEPPVGGTA